MDTNMPAIVRSEFALALNQVATERGLDPSVILETIKAAILAAYRKDYGADELPMLIVEVDSDSGEAKIFKDGKDVTPPGFGRIAAQTAKQVILQRIREAEKQAVLADYQNKIGSIIPGMVLRFDGPNIIVDIGRTQAVMPSQEQSQGERYHLNQRLTFYIEGIRETARGNEIVVSRAHKGLVEGLFRREVPEVAQASVELRIVAREAGGRTKVAVYSNQSGVDPVGSCVGQKGVRVQAVINELGGNEKVDIIQWSDDIKQFITAALAPAKDMDVSLDTVKKSAVVSIAEDQLSLAIGREGQNVRLAAKVTGWKIDIRAKEGKEAESAQKTTVAPSSGNQGSVSAGKKGKKSKKASPKKAKLQKEKQPETITIAETVASADKKE
ncbi:transcription termination factor NusA [Patescibacteria group bacterium]|nr:transcription termination factor NusA [Patescibacteria group bacterium]MBU1472358.1 transcription termination factor NusA [Patescibacteria group bacterium]